MTNSILKYLKFLGYDVSTIFEGLPYTEEYLVDPFNWVTYSTRELICQWAADLVNDGTFMFQVGFMIPKLRPLGGIEVIVKLLSSPKAAFERIPKYASLFDKVFTFEVKIHGNTRTTVTMFKPEEYLVSRHSCYYAQGILAAIPTVWGLPMVEVHETRCMS